MSEEISDQIYRDRVYENQGFSELVDLVGPRQHRVLDVGCGAGANLRRLSLHGHDAVGLTISEAEARVVRESGFSCVVHDISESVLPFPPVSFDALLFSHVLEHVAWPAQVLRRYLSLLRPGGSVFVALPNALHVSQRLEFLSGRFRYTETGIMDETHLRWFDFVTARQLVEKAGLEVVGHFGIGQCPVGPLRLISPGLGQWMDRWTTKRWPGMFAFHLIVIGRLTDLTPTS